MLPMAPTIGPVAGTARRRAESRVSRQKLGGPLDGAAALVAWRPCGPLSRPCPCPPAASAAAADGGERPEVDEEE